jgi:hypothetical protein
MKLHLALNNALDQTNVSLSDAKLTVTNDGNVGIGTTGPGNLLTVVQTSATDPIADAWTTYSSGRWKENQSPITDALTKIDKLNPVYFDWKAEYGGKHDLGLVAEEAGKIVPEVVAWEDNGMDAKSIDYARLSALTIAGIKEQQGQIASLSGQLAALKTGSTVQVKIDPDSPPIEVGDFLTSSDKPGLAMKATQAGYTVAKALETWQPGSGTELVEAFVNLSYFDPDVYLTSTGDLQIVPNSAEFVYDGNLPQFPQFSLISQTGQVISRAAAFSEAAVANLRAGLIQSQKIITNSLISPIAQISQIIADKITVREKIVSPIAEIEELKTNTISPLSAESDGIAVELGDAQTFGVYNGQGPPVALFDAQGNATLSGTLYADRIVTRFGDLDERLAEIATPSASIVREIDATSSALLALLAQDVAHLKTTANTPVELSASDSGTITIPSDLTVLGHTALGETSVAGPVFISGPLTLGSDGIQTLDDTLYIQKNKLANVDILGGTLTINTVGDVIIAGNLAVSGNLAVGGILGVNTIVPLHGDLTIDLEHPATPSAFGRLLIRGAGGEIVTAFDASGSARFAGDLEARRGIFRDLVVGASASGTLAVGAGETSVAVTGLEHLPGGDSDYMLSVFPNWNTTVWASDKQPDRFTINFGTPPISSASADWLIIRRQ